MSNQSALRHAYLIAAHEKPAQLKTLLGLLDDENNDIYLHIDRKAKGFVEEELRVAAPNSRVFFVPGLDARWGDEPAYREYKTRTPVLVPGLGRG